MKRIILKSLVTISLTPLLFMTGCATTTLVKKNTGSYTKTNKINLIDDNVVAFGKPSQVQSNLPSDSIVIAGEKNSYVLTKGGPQFFQLITKLDPKNIQITKELSFYSEKNDGHFVGTLPLTYVQLKEDISKQDLQFYIQNGAEECTSASDQRMQAQRFCFNIKLEGVVYPAARNLTSLKALSKAYKISIYTNQKETVYKSGNAVEKLMLLPFAVAFDVISLPFQAAEKIFD